MMNQKTKILMGQRAREAVLRGVSAVYDVVRKTLGPEGRNVLMYGLYGRNYRLTNDGATSAAVIEPKDEFEVLGAAVVKDASERTNEKAGDATTTTVVIAGKIIQDIFAKVETGGSAIGSDSAMSPIRISRALLASSKKVVEELKSRAIVVESIDDLKKIAYVSMENREISDIVAEMAWKVGKDGFIDVVEGFRGSVETEVIEGARFAAKIPAKGFVNNPAKREMVATDVAVLLTNWDLDNVGQVAKFLNPILKNHPKLAILAPEFSRDVLEDLWKASYENLSTPQGIVRQKKALEIYPIKTPSLKTEQWEDLEVYFGGRFVDKNKGMKLWQAGESDLGFASKITVKDTDTRDDAIALGGRGTISETVEIAGRENKLTTAVQNRIQVLTQQIEETKEEAHKNILRRRIASLGNAVGVIRVGAPSDAETYYLKKKVEDGVYSCKSALEEGYVRGGGLCLKEIAEGLMPDDLLRPALLAVHEQIEENAGGEIEIGPDVIDPVKALRYAVEHAVSAAANLITMEAVIAEERDKGQAEGMEEVANALRWYTYHWAKERGVLRENDKEIEADRLAQEDAIMRNFKD